MKCVCVCVSIYFNNFVISIDSIVIFFKVNVDNPYFHSVPNYLPRQS